MYCINATDRNDNNRLTTVCPGQRDELIPETRHWDLWLNNHSPLRIVGADADSLQLLLAIFLVLFELDWEINVPFSTKICYTGTRSWVEI